jgi:hypothetical protein
MALFGAIIAVGLGPALWLGAQFGQISVDPAAPAPPITVDADRGNAPGRAGAAVDDAGLDDSKKVVQDDTGVDRELVPLSSTPSSRPSSRAPRVQPTPTRSPSSSPTRLVPSPSRSTAPTSTPPTESTSTPPETQPSEPVVLPSTPVDTPTTDAGTPTDDASPLPLDDAHSA